MSYDITTNVGKVRLIIGDKDVANEVFTDDEISAFIALEGSINLASAAALEAWAAQYAPNASSEQIGDYSYKQDIVNRMLGLAKKLREKESNIPVLDIASANLTAGSAITDEED